VTVAEREVQFLAELHTELVDEFGDEVGGQLFGMAAGEFLAGPSGVTRMFERSQTFRSKTS